MTKYVVVADIHVHNWSLFSATLPNGVNSRLQFILNEMERAAKFGLKAGAKFMVIAGDLFHVRGSIDPEVLNPTRSAIKKILECMDIYAIPGNHDLKSRDTTELSSAIQNMNDWTVEHNGKQHSFHVINEVTTITKDGVLLGFVPWRHEKEGVIEGLRELQKHKDYKNMDVFIHYGIEGVLPVISGNELTARELADFGFKRVLAGHYHNHKVFPAGVCSIGAIAHHNWGDVDTRAGFVILDSADDAINYFSGTAPSFIDVSGMNEDSLILSCPNNYVRFRGKEMTQRQIIELRTALQGYGALGVSIEAPRSKTSSRGSTASGKSISIETTIDNFVDAEKYDPQIDTTKIKTAAHEVLKESRTALFNT